MAPIPSPKAACAALADLDHDANGAEIDASFSQQNGCEIARREAISGVLATGYGATG